MNNETREEMVADLTVILQRVKYVRLGESLRPIAEEIIDKLLADRAVPEPAADAIYRERNQVVAALSKCFYSWIGTVDDAEPGWTKAVYIDLPSGQVSWHVPDHEIPDLFGHLQESGEPWDGHTTEEKYERLAALAAVPTVQAAAGDDLDELLRHLTDDGLPGKTLSIYRHDGQWGAQQMTTYLEEPDSPTDICGHGATAREAILDAVAKAKGAGR